MTSIIARPLVQTIARPIVGTLLNTGGATTKTFITLDPVLNAYYSLSSTQSFAGSYELEFDFASTATGSVMDFFDGGFGVDTFDNFVMPASVSALDVNGISVGLASAVPLDGKLNHVKITGSIDTIAFIGQSGSSTNYFDGIISNVKLTDLATPANSLTFALDNPVDNTEINNGVTLTYNNIPTDDRELFTLVDGDWLGGELLPSPLQFNTQWTGALNAINITDNSYTTDTAGGTGVYYNHGAIGGLRLNYDVVSDDSFWHIKDSISGSGIDPTILTPSSSSESGVIDYDSVNGGVYLRHFNTSGILVTADNLSVKKLIEVG